MSDEAFHRWSQSGAGLYTAGMSSIAAGAAVTIAVTGLVNLQRTLEVEKSRKVRSRCADTQSLYPLQI